RGSVRCRTFLVAAASEQESEQKEDHGCCAAAAVNDGLVHRLCHGRAGRVDAGWRGLGCRGGREERLVGGEREERVAPAGHLAVVVGGGTGLRQGRGARGDLVLVGSRRGGGVEQVDRGAAPAREACGGRGRRDDGRAEGRARARARGVRQQRLQVFGFEDGD